MIPNKIYPEKMPQENESPCPYCVLNNWPKLCKDLTGGQFAFQGCALNGVFYYWANAAPCMGKGSYLEVSKLQDMGVDQRKQMVFELMARANEA
ncbi:MAG: hypothetical protein FWC51_04670 [Proteobacteria bacterium]|nr:hypothetical protein [Pseudomonadota bacterium]